MSSIETKTWKGTFGKHPGHSPFAVIPFGLFYYSGCGVGKMCMCWSLLTTLHDMPRLWWPHLKLPSAQHRLWDNFTVHYGLPESLILDHGQNFESDLIIELCKMTKSESYAPDCIILKQMVSVNVSIIQLSVC